MWPKAFAQFIELAPHISRLLPMADRFLQSKTATEEGGRRVLEASSAALQADLGRIAAAQGGISRQMNVLGEGIAVLSNDMRATKTTLESLEMRFSGSEAVDTRLTGIENRLGGLDAHLQRVGERVRLGPVVLLLVLTNLILLAAVIGLLVRGR